jgi:hypothetical protein
MNVKRNLLIILFFALFSNYLKSQSVEYFVKASLIEKFARFTEWEPNTIGGNFVIGVLGKSPFYNELEKLSIKIKIKNKPVKILYLNNMEDAKVCQVLFICSSEKDNLPEIIKYLGNYNILLVGDTEGFSEKGVHFNFYLEKNENIHFEINVKALAKANLKTDMQLLSLGKITK